MRPRSGFDYFVTHKGQGKYFGTEWSLNGEKRVTPGGYYTTEVTDLALAWLKGERSGETLGAVHRPQGPAQLFFSEEKYAHAFDSVRVPYPQTAFELDDKPAWIKERLSTWHGIYGPLFEWRKKFPDTRPEAVEEGLREHGPCLLGHDSLGGQQRGAARDT